MFAAVLLNCALEVEGPDTTLQAPVPLVGTFAASAIEPLLMHMVWSGPALETVGVGFTTTANCGVVALVLPFAQVVVAT